MKKEKYVQAPMVNWYHPRMLLNIGLKALISGTFGNYADRRELEAALDDNTNDKDWKELEDAYCAGKEDIWIDVVNDTGDGFNATFAIARCVAKRQLSLKVQGQESAGTFETPRAKVLIFGGDEVYPFPTIEAYTQKFKIPFASAAMDRDDIDLKNDQDRPHLYAIPGNHDWYDGLGNFIKLFCQGRWIGIWSTKQHRSYFALPLPNRYWIWATDIQLNSDIDAPQLHYFRTVANEKMKEGDKVILITAEPAWVFHELLKEDRSFHKLKFFVDNYIHNADKRHNNAFKLAATLTGDLHHYARYQRKDDNNGHQYITAGGGGAFLHETHSLPKCLKGIGKGDIFCQSTFPDRKESRGLMLWNFIFPLKNPLFTSLLFGIYLIFFAVLHNNIPRYFNNLRSDCPELWSFFAYTGRWLLHSPGTFLLSVLIGFGFYAFSDTKITNPWSKLPGALHGILQVMVLYLTMYFIGIGPLCGMCPGAGWLVRAAGIVGICALGALAAGFLFGIYLYLSNLLLGMHINEASSSLACEDYKNFLRLHVHKDGVTIYPIGIRKVPRKWETMPEEGDPTKPSDERYSFKGSEEPQAFLIEPPIHIHNDKL